MKVPAISVILPVFNGERYLRDSMQSVLNQSFRDLELIFVDDCSTDTSVKIAESFAKKDNRVKIIHNKKNLKLPEALNAGFERARGRLYTWTSCDNIFKENALQVMKAKLDQSEADFVYADMDKIDENNKFIGKVTAGNADDLIIRNVVGACFLYKSTIGKKVGCYDPKMFLIEDYDYWLRVSMNFKMIPLHENLYQYRVHNKSLSSNHEGVVIAKSIKLRKKLFPKLVHSKKRAAEFYCFLRAYDVYNPFRHFYWFIAFFYSPMFFFSDIYEVFKNKFVRIGHK